MPSPNQEQRRDAPSTDRSERGIWAGVRKRDATRGGKAKGWPWLFGIALSSSQIESKQSLVALHVRRIRLSGLWGRRNGPPSFHGCTLRMWRYKI